MKRISGKGNAPFISVVAVVLCATGIVIAQQQTETKQQTSTSTSTSPTGASTASGFASAKATSSSSARGGAQGGGQLGGPVATDNRPYYAVWYEYQPKAQNATKDPMVEHDTYMVALMKKGMVTLEGPFADRTGALLILRADNDDIAKQVVFSDPTVQNGWLKPTIKRWNVHESRFFGSTGNSERGVSIGAPVGGG